MCDQFSSRKLVLILVLLAMQTAGAQVLTLKEAIETGVQNYGTVKAKENFSKASQAGVEQARKEYLPNLNLAVQKDYGTVNGQIGPLYGFGGLGVASSGLPSAQQNWNAAFGALYLTNVNWDIFAFGRAKERVKTAEALAKRDESDWQQEVFQHKVKVAAAYLNLLAAQRLTISYRKNLERADAFRTVVVNRAKNGLIPGVDSSLANAEVSNARIALTNATDREQEQSNQLARLLGVTHREFALDTLFIGNLPARIADTDNAVPTAHPLLRYYEQRVRLSQKQTDYLRTFYFPAFSVVGILQTRGSGFANNYASDNTAFTHNIFDGFKPTRSNYLIGVGVNWNLTQGWRVSRQVKAQTYTSLGFQNEYDLANQQLTAQLELARSRIKNALDNYREVPLQVKAAGDAYVQKTALYKNGLANLVDVTQALYSLIRAETDRDIVYNNVWQALLFKAAASGDLGLMEN